MSIRQKYRTYYLSKAYRENGKNKKQNIHKLGKLSDQEVDEIRLFLKTLKTPSTFTTTLQDLTVEKHFAYLDVAVAHEIWKYWNLDSVFSDDGNREVSASTVACILTLNRCLDPAAKSRFPEWFQGTSMHWILDVDQELINPFNFFMWFFNLFVQFCKSRSDLEKLYKVEFVDSFKLYE